MWGQKFGKESRHTRPVKPQEAYSPAALTPVASLKALKSGPEQSKKNEKNVVEAALLAYCTIEVVGKFFISGPDS